MVDPRAPSDALWRRQAPSLLRRGNGRIVLVIEPNPLAGDLVSSALKPLGFTIIRAHNGEAALGVARRTLPSLILMELMLPGLSALETLAAMDEVPSLAAIPVVALCSVAPSEVLPPAAVAELATWVAKPIDAGRLLATVTRFVA